MSGQPYRYFTDPTKYRTEFMEALGLRADLDTMNFDANKTYKETGQLPAVSQLKDTRTTDQVLMDYEKLKIDIIQSVAKISSPQFGQLVVQRLIDSPLNSDNKFLIFTAQRIVDIVDNIKKLYRYGIKGDENDAEQFVNFVASMYNDKNQIAAQTKTFMNRQGIRSMSGASSIFSTLYEYLTKLGSNLLTMNNKVHLYQTFFAGLVYNSESKKLDSLLLSIISILGEITSYIVSLKQAIPSSGAESTAIEQLLLQMAQGKDFTQQASNIQKFGEKGKTRGSVLARDYAAPEEDYESDIEEFLFKYLDFLNTSLPSVGILISIDNQVNTFWRQADGVFSRVINKESWNGIYDLITKDSQGNNDYSQVDKKLSGFIDACISNFSILEETLLNLDNALQPNREWDESSIKLLIKLKNQHNIRQEAQNVSESFKRFGDLPVYTAPSYGTGEDEPTPYARQQTSSSSSSSSASSTRDPILDELDEILKPEEKKEGSGIKKRRGRPMGRGIAKPVSYKESVKAHAVLDKGIMETPRFLKFGKYLVNNHRLHNEDIFALKRPSGGNIVEIPSIKVSKSLGGVIKKMLGGAIPTYSDISKLSEPEKAYLHKISQKSNILDKFDIPAPAKDNMEKDIHQFEVMRGEIMAGNDSKELLKKFKLHILKLSKSGTLPKREVQEILEDLLELGN